LVTLQPYSSFVVGRSAVFVHQFGIAAEDRRVHHVAEVFLGPGPAAVEVICNVVVDGVFRV
jgi:hypothetical protein